MRPRVARDCLRHGLGQPGENHKRMEIVRPPPQNAVVQTTQRRKGGEEQTLGSVHQICTRTVVELLSASAEASKSAADMRVRRSRTRVDTVDLRVHRAEALICMGEISAARHALEGSPVAPGTEETYNALTDANRRPPEPRPNS